MDWLRWILLLIGAAIVVAIWWTGYRRTRERDETLFERARRDPGSDSTGQAPASGDFAAGADTGPALPPDLDVASFEPFPADQAEPDLQAAPDIQTGNGDGDGRRDKADAQEESASEPPDESAASASTRAEPMPEAPPQRTRPETGATGGEAAAGPGSTGEGAAERIESVFLVASGGERFVGSRLQELFTHHGLRHGEMGIFHLHDPEGHIQFSVANLVEPGTFDPATMDTLSTPGIALFLRLPGPPSAEVAFDRMIRTARSMTDQLEGRLLDQQQSTLTRQTEQHLRDQMRGWDHQNRRSRA